MLKTIQFDADDALKAAAMLYRDGKRHALKDESADGIGCMLKALTLLEPMKGDDHRVLRAECLYFIGMMEIWRGRNGTAHDVLDEATKLNPDTPVYWAFLAQACMNLGCKEKAIYAAERAEERHGNNNVVLSMLATIWENYGQPERAKLLSESASSFSENDPDACYLLGNSYYIKNNKPEAAKWYKRAIELSPDHPDANYGYGLALSENLHFRESLPYFTKGMNSQISGHSSKWGKALAHLILGEYEQGFADHEVRFVFLKHEYGIALTNHRFDKPQWNGETEPSRIHVYSEQGFGDCIQFCRYVHLLCDMGHEVVLEVDNSMIDLMRYNFPKATVIPISKDYPGVKGIPDVDYRIPMGSLPYAFKTTLETIPCSSKYLSADPEKIKEWPLIANAKGLKVGLCWAGGKRVQDKNLVAMDEKRSINFEKVKTLLDVPNATFFSLQTGLAAEECKDDNRIYPTMKGIKSWMDTAAIIANLDVVISVDTSVLHMAASMGKETFLLNKHSTCWRWLLDRTDSPWYNSIRIFRPKAPDAWEQVVSDAKEALCRL